MTIPETIWAWRYYDRDEPMALGEWYTQDVGLVGSETEYIRADIADARVAAAYDAAAELACERLSDSWSWDDEDFLSCVIADLKRHIIKAGPTQNAKAALEAVRREERQFGIPVAAALAAAISLLERGGKQAAASDKMFDQMLTDYQRALNDYRALIDKETTE